MWCGKAVDVLAACFGGCGVGGVGGVDFDCASGGSGAVAWGCGGAGAPAAAAAHFLHAHSPCRWLAWSWKTGCNVPRSCLLPIMSPLCGCPAAGRSSSGLTLNHAWLLLPATTCAEKLQQQQHASCSGESWLKARGCQCFPICM